MQEGTRLRRAAARVIPHSIIGREDVQIEISREPAGDG